jgi:hypothetical protein
MSQHNNHTGTRRDLPVRIRYMNNGSTIPEIVIHSEGWPGIMRVQLNEVVRVI